jgi:hypothetical protein
MKQLPFYDEYIHNVVIHKMVEVVGVKKPSSKAEFRRAFNDYYGLNVSYEQFNTWIRDLGIQVEKQATISVPGVGVRDDMRPPAEPPALHPGQAPPQQPVPQQAPQPNQLEYMFGAAPQQNPQQPQHVPNMPAPGRGGINLPG